MSVPNPSPPVHRGGLLAAALGSEADAAEWRRRRALRERMELRAGLARDLRALHGDRPSDPETIFRELRSQRDALAELRYELRRVRAIAEAAPTTAEVAEALDYHRTHGGQQENGTPQPVA